MRFVSMITLAAVTLLAMAAGLPSAGNAATDTVVTATSTVALDFTTGRIWEDDEGVQHGRGIVLTYQVSGEAEGIPFTGTGTGEISWNTELATGNGDGFTKKDVYEITWGDLSGTFSGHASWTATGGQNEGTFVHIGRGDFRQMKWEGSFTGAIGSVVTESVGQIHDAHGR